MSVQVVYKNKAKTSDLGEIVLFSDEKFQIKSGKSIFSKAQIVYIEKILKNKKKSKKNFISFNINEKTNLILISLKNSLKSFDVESLGAAFYDFVKKNSFSNISIITDSIYSKPWRDFIGRFIHGLKLKSYEFNIYKSKKAESNITINLIGKQSSLRRDKFYQRSSFGAWKYFASRWICKKTFKIKKTGIESYRVW